MAAADQTPYVGPRPFGRDEKDLFFRRDRETRDLCSLVVAHPIVLLYAASGAGKSSLLNAGLIPLLEARGYEVLPSARVSGRIPDAIKTSEVNNVYAFNVLSSWAGPSVDPRDLVKADIASFLANRPHREDAAGEPVLRVVLLDQFEVTLYVCARALAGARSVDSPACRGARTRSAAAHRACHATGIRRSTRDVCAAIAAGAAHALSTRRTGPQSGPGGNRGTTRADRQKDRARGESAARGRTADGHGKRGGRRGHRDRWSLRRAGAAASRLREALGRSSPGCPHDYGRSHRDLWRRRQSAEAVLRRRAQRCRNENGRVQGPPAFVGGSLSHYPRGDARHGLPRAGKHRP